MGRKIRGDSVLDNLPLEQFTALRDWFALENLTYEKAKERLAEEFGVETSPASLMAFYRRHCVGFKHRKARDFAAEVGKVFRESENNFDDATINLIEQRAFEQAAANEADIDDLVALAKILGDTRKLALQREKLEIEKRRVTLLEQKAAKLDKVQEDLDADDGLTAEERLAKIREGLKV
ncbi:MAG: hypothetical protein ACQKBU_10055 [Verrucomicrobiales bacterium]